MGWSHALQEMIEHKVEAINGIGMQARWISWNVRLIVKRKAKSKSDETIINNNLFFFSIGLL